MLRKRGSNLLMGIVPEDAGTYTFLVASSYAPM